MLRPYLVLSDHLGSTSTTANADGTLHSVIQYTAFGEIRSTQGNTPTKYRYTGQLAQAELGLDYYVARYYDPLTGHFTQADSIIPEPGKASAFDRYAYVLNNPIRYNDPSGHRPMGPCGPGEDCDKKPRPKTWEEAKKNTDEDSEEAKSKRGSIYLGSLSYNPRFTFTNAQDSSCLGCSMEPEGNANPTQISGFAQSANALDVANTAFGIKNNFDVMFGKKEISIYANYEDSKNGSRSIDSITIINMSGWHISVRSVSIVIRNQGCSVSKEAITLMQSPYLLYPKPSISSPKDYSSFPPSIPPYSIRDVSLIPSGYSGNPNNTIYAYNSASIGVIVGSDNIEGMWPGVSGKIK